MSFVDILFRVMPTAPNELDRLSIAVDLARRTSARLNGVFVTTSVEDKGDLARALFERAITRSPLETTWRQVDGGSSAGLLFHMRRADLTILPCTDVGRLPCPVEQLILSSGRPSLILPTPVVPRAIGITILVGWSDSPESARAIHDAMPLLSIAEKVYVVTVIPDRDLEPCADVTLLDHLRQNGVAAELERRYGADAAEELAAESRRTGSDILVVGFNGTTTRRAVTLGDVSRRFARTGSLPVFCSH